MPAGRSRHGTSGRGLNNPSYTVTEHRGSEQPSADSLPTTKRDGGPGLSAQNTMLRLRRHDVLRATRQKSMSVESDECPCPAYVYVRFFIGTYGSSVPECHSGDVQCAGRSIADVCGPARVLEFFQRRKVVWWSGSIVVKVFVSSTSSDLTDFRTAAIRSLRRLGHEVVAMEEFTAATSFPLDRVLKLVRDADAYVLIVAWRYGFIPDISKVANLPVAEDNTFTKSITEWEYLAAKENPERPILPFILSESSPWPPQNIDGFDLQSPGDQGSLERIKTFRAGLMRDHIVSFFSREDELEALVSAAITTARLSRGVLINRIGIGNPVQGGMTIPDSYYSGGIVGIVRDAGSERVITIDIATDWWSTRLYLLAFLLDRLTSAQRILVVDRGKFVGLLPLTTITRVIASLHNQIQSFEQTDRARALSEPDVSREADVLIEMFKQAFPLVPTTGAAAHPDEALSSERLAKVDVTRANLVRWFKESIITSPIRVDNIERASPIDLIRLFDYPGDFVPVIVGQGDDSSEQSRSHVIDKPALSLQLARAYVTDLFDEGRP
jgi:Domain of unknown function (DUF4062)